MVNFLLFIGGAISMCNIIAALLFARFYRRTSDRLFLMFAIAFVVLTADSITATILTKMTPAPEASGDHPALYVVRLLSFLFIIIAILDKNRKSRAGRAL